MDESKIIRSIGDVKNELQNIGDGLTALAAAEKKYFDDSLGSTIKEALLEVLAKISAVEAGKNYYHNSLIETIKNSLSEVIEKVGNIKIDMSPIMKMAGDINNQNKEVVKAILNMPKPENNDEKYQELMLLTIGIVEKNNILMTRLIEKQETKVIDITPREKLKIEFKVTNRDQYTGKIDTFLAVEK